MNRAIMKQALDALEYHVQQTRPIHNTDLAIEALRTWLAKPDLAHDLHPDNDPLGMRAAYTHAAIADAREMQHRYTNEHYTQCKGTNCTATMANQKHSDECIKEHEAAYSGIAKPESGPVAFMRNDGLHVVLAVDRHNYHEAEKRFAIPLFTKEQL